MPIFRVFGGGRDSSSSTNNRSISSRLCTGGTSNNPNSDPNSHSTTNNSQSYLSGSTSTYPGLRIQQRNSSNSNNHNNGGIGIGVGSHPSRGLISSIHTNSAQSIPSHNNVPYVSSQTHAQSPQIIRGSNVPRSNTQMSVPFMPSPPGRTSLNSAGRSTSVGSTTFPSPTTPYVGNGISRSTNTYNSSTNSSSGVSTSASASTSDSRPGAYSITRSNGNGSSQIYRVTVPPGVIPGNEFTVHAGTRRVRVRCPPTSRPGHSLQITLPPEPITTSDHLHIARLTRASRIDNDPTGESEDPFMRYDSIGNGGAEEMNAEILRINKSGGSGAPKTFLVSIPPNVFPGMHFTVTAEGQKFKVTCPPNAGPGKKVRIVAPNTGRGQDSKPPEVPEMKSDPKMQVYEVIVPQGVRPNQPFTLMANNQRVLVTCPPNVSAGQKIRFQLPVPVAKSNGNTNICLSYKDESGSSGWERTVRVTDHKFQWIRVSEENDDDCKKKSSIDDFVTSSSQGARAVEDMTSFDLKKAAYVRKIQFLEGNDARMRTGIVSLVPANEAVVHSDYTDKNYHGTNSSKKLFDYNDIAQIQCKSMDDKVEWFHNNICGELYTPWEKGHVKIVVRRDSLLEDSVSAIMSLGRNDMRKRWRIEFAGEPGIEAGGLTREWFQLVTEQIFDPDFGLWLSSCNNQMSMQINPASHISCPDDYLRFFRFLGRVMGRALFDRQLIKGHMVRHLYKHLLGWPITFDDLEAQDEEYYSALKKMTAMDDPSMMCLDFTVTEEHLGVRKDIALVPGGETMEVTSENFSEYLEANLKYRMLNRCKPQITELMLGFFDIIPEPALTIFDPNELELILCGLPTIDMNDWMDNTKYSGYFESRGKRHQVVEWFWQVVQNDFDQEMRARLLQFVTGTSGVPPRGFSVLQGNDGNIKKFCVHGVSRDQYVYPRAHTCFNRIDLPNYSSKYELMERLGQAVSMTYVGFDIE